MCKAPPPNVKKATGDGSSQTLSTSPSSFLVLRSRLRPRSKEGQPGVDSFFDSRLRCRFFPRPVKCARDKRVSFCVQDLHNWFWPRRSPVTVSSEPLPFNSCTLYTRDLSRSTHLRAARTSLLAAILKKFPHSKPFPTHEGIRSRILSFFVVKNTNR